MAPGSLWGVTIVCDPPPTEIVKQESPVVGGGIVCDPPPTEIVEEESPVVVGSIFVIGEGISVTEKGLNVIETEAKSGGVDDQIVNAALSIQEQCLSSLDVKTDPGAIDYGQSANVVRASLNGKKVVCKLLRLNPSNSDRFIVNEVWILLKIWSEHEHKNIYPLMQCKLLPEHIALVFPCFDMTVQDLCDYSEGTLDPLFRFHVILGLINALKHLHGLYVVHNDVKGSNVMVLKKGKEVKLIDFGCATSMEKHAPLPSSATEPPGLPAPPDYSWDDLEKNRGTDNTQSLTFGKTRTTDDVSAALLLLSDMSDYPHKRTKTHSPSGSTRTLLEEFLQKLCSYYWDSQKTIPESAELHKKMIQEKHANPDIICPPDWESKISACLAAKEEGKPRNSHKPRKPPSER